MRRARDRQKPRVLNHLHLNNIYSPRACNSFNAFGERYPLCLEHLYLLSRCKRSLDYLNVRHVTNTCTSRDKHMYVTWQTPICYVSLHPSAMWQTPTQYTDRGRFVCIVRLLRKRNARRTTGLYSRNRLYNTFGRKFAMWEFAMLPNKKGCHETKKGWHGCQPCSSPSRILIINLLG